MFLVGSLMSHHAAIVQLVSTVLRPFSTNMQLHKGVQVGMYNLVLVGKPLVHRGTRLQSINVSTAGMILGIVVFITKERITVPLLVIL